MITVISVVETKGLSMDELEERSSTAARQLKDCTSVATDVTRSGELIKGRHRRSPIHLVENYCEIEFASRNGILRGRGTVSHPSKISERACGATVQ